MYDGGEIEAGERDDEERLVGVGHDVMENEGLAGGKEPGKGQKAKG